jgi:type I site-specific restriction-modification system R (restriction) subunit
VATDRKDLHDQIRNLSALRLPQSSAARSVRHLREMLISGDGHPDDGAEVPGSRNRSAGARTRCQRCENVLVMVDEAHRTQYRSLYNTRGAPTPAFWLAR